MGEKKYCRGRLYAYSLPTVNIYKDLELNFTILCTQPLLLSFDDFARNIAEIGEGLAFNFEIPETGVNFGTFTFAREIYIDNQGDTVEPLLKRLERLQIQNYSTKINIFVY